MLPLPEQQSQSVVLPRAFGKIPGGGRIGPARRSFASSPTHLQPEPNAGGGGSGG